MSQPPADMKAGYNYAMVDEQLLYADGYLSAAHAWEFVESGFFPTPYYEAKKLGLALKLDGKRKCCDEHGPAVWPPPNGSGHTVPPPKWLSARSGGSGSLRREIATETRR